MRVLINDCEKPERRIVKVPDFVCFELGGRVGDACVRVRTL